VGAELTPASLGCLFKIGELKITGPDTRNSDVFIQTFPPKGEAVQAEGDLL
jgi:hypothetical protein